MSQTEIVTQFPNSYDPRSAENRTGVGTIHVSQDRHTAFHQGYLLGQITTYCEQVLAGGKLAAQFSCNSEYQDYVVEHIEGEGCRYLIDQQAERISVWVFKYPFVESLIKSQPPASEAGIWMTGKLFGYSDYEISRFLEASGCTVSTRSTCEQESSPR